ncbi:tetratricopeptide repeat protein [Dickeya zeae]|uniref:Tetratricopeptide repeat protein n=1 Tax=Dickeya zeae TaxID=204042 RepID=A0ABX8VVT9_9GAMM|nr:hypothetical protein [Dickeya zeae]QYM90443.1 hypothetical protein FGI21_00425 [Dickeya zeae]
MEGFEEIRPMEGMFAPLDVRRELREMFARWLSKPSHLRPARREDEWVDEHALLSLCKHYRLEYPGEAADLAQRWNASETRQSEGAPHFDELINQGWIFFDGSRWMMQGSPSGTRAQIVYPSPGTQRFLEGLSKPRLTPKSENPPTAIKALSEKIVSEYWLEHYVPVENSKWFLGRLWEQLCPAQAHNPEQALTQKHATEFDEGTDNSLSAIVIDHDNAVDSAFREWAAWCHVVESSSEWDFHWIPAHRKLCREAAHRVLTRQTLWGLWEDDLTRYVDVLLNTYKIPHNQVRFADCTRKDIPRTLVAKAGWLASREAEHIMMGRLMTGRADLNTVSFAFGLLCSELEKTDIGPDVLSASKAVLSFAVNHPLALLILRFRIDVCSPLLVDMLMYPPTVCLAAQWTTGWQLQGRSRNSARKVQMKSFAVQDALSCVAYHLTTGSLYLEECAALITWCYIEGAPIRGSIAGSQRSVGHQILELVARQNEQVQSKVLGHLVEQVSYRNNVPRACFSGALEGMKRFPLVTQDVMLLVVTIYSAFAHDRNLDWTDVSGLSSELAGCLVAVACEQDALVRDAFLYPLDGTALIHESPRDEQLIVRSSVARTMRAHVRLLARAVSGWQDDALPTALCNALKKLISRSVIEHDEKGRIGALTDRYSPGNALIQEEGSPAQDLVAAWHKLDENNQQDLLQVFAQSDDPVLLAELCQYLPGAAKAGIKLKLRQLRPGEASNFWTWTELQHRIETLQNAGEYDLAREHLDEVRQEFDRAPPQSRLALFTLELRLYLREENWVALDNAVIPSTLRAETARKAREELQFYQATSQLLRPDGNLVHARAELKRLSALHGASPAYIENYFAVAIQQIIGATIHPIAGAEKQAGEHLLAEINSVVNGSGYSASTSLLANRALLLIALGEYEEALESLYERRRETRSSDLEMAVVLAKHKMGLWNEAMAILDAATTEFEMDKRLVALRDELQAGQPVSRIASASVDGNDLNSIRIALQQLVGLECSQIGEILGPVGQGLRGYLIREVSNAVASLQRMAGMLRDRKDSSNDARLEDDLNTAVREVLNASFKMIKWNVSDQSLGGLTVNGNPGERDLVIRTSSSEIAVYEALVCDGVDRTNIKKHFDKLPAYGYCDTYFYVIYSYADKVKPLLEYVGEMLQHTIPSRLVFRNFEVLKSEDYGVSGYLATYTIDHREVEIVFMITDLKIRTL